MSGKGSASLVLAGALIGVASVVAFTPTPMVIRAAADALAAHVWRKVN